MNIVFLPHGDGSGATASEYLLGAFDHSGEERSEVKVIRGNPNLTARLIDSLPHVWRYTSCVVAWHELDRPSDDQIIKILDLFERLGFAGLQPDQFDISVVQHRDIRGAPHLHIVIPRVELSSRKTLNIAPPLAGKSWAKRLRDYANVYFGWARPDDPERARLLRPARGRPPEAERLAQAITDNCVDQVEAGSVRSQQDVITIATQFGKLLGTGRDYVSINAFSTGRPLRLAGLMFSSGEMDIPRILRAGQVRSGEVIVQADPPNPSLADREFLPLVQQCAQWRATVHRSKYPYRSPWSEGNDQEHGTQTSLRGFASLPTAENVRSDAAYREAFEPEPTAAHGSGRHIGRALRGPARGPGREIGETLRAAQSAERPLERVVGRVHKAFDALGLLLREVEELESKCPIVEFALDAGYEVDRDRGDKYGIYLRGARRNLIVGQEHGRGVYVETLSGSSGSVVELARTEYRISLPGARDRIRSWLGRHLAIRPNPAPRPMPTSKAGLKLMAKWFEMPLLPGRSLVRLGISKETSFLFDVREDELTRPAWAHRDADGRVTGWEVRAATETQPVLFGQRGLCRSRLCIRPIRRIVVTETINEAMSFAELAHEDDDLYVSTAGDPDDLQLAAIGRLSADNPGVLLCLATRGGAGEARLLERLRAYVSPATSIVSQRPDRHVSRHEQLASPSASLRRAVRRP